MPSIERPRVISAYYPIQPRFGLPGCPNKQWVGDPVRQAPLLGYSYNNKTNRNVLEFDIRAMKAAGVTVMNLHLFGSYNENVELMERINSICLTVGMWWTPTFESFTHDAVQMSAHTNAAIQHFLPSSPGIYSAFFRDYDGNYVVFLYLSADSTLSRDANAQRAAHGIDLIRANSGPVNIYLDDGNCSMGQPCQNGNGDGAISDWFSGADVTHNKQRVQGFYSWQPASWAMKANQARRQIAGNYVQTATNGGFRPVVATIPSFNEENWGYGDSTGNGPGGHNNCGIGGDRSQHPRYNVTRDSSEWATNLDAVLEHTNSRCWLYIQAYDEWAEGSTLAPNTYDGALFLAELKKALNRHGWWDDSTPYVLPPVPNSVT